MCEPISVGIATIAGNVIQGNMNRDAASKQAGMVQAGVSAAGNRITAGNEQATNYLTQGTNQAVGTLNPFYDMGVKAGQGIFDLATGANPLTSDPMLQRELQLSNQMASARGMSLSPSFQAETLAALIPGVATRKASLLSPIFSTGYGAAGTIAGLQSGLGTNLANMTNEYSANMANLGLMGNQAQVKNVGLQVPQLSGLISQLGSTFGGSNIFGNGGDLKVNEDTGDYTNRYIG